jgi:hypothetical protein
VRDLGCRPLVHGPYDLEVEGQGVLVLLCRAPAVSPARQQL